MNAKKPKAKAGMKLFVLRTYVMAKDARDALKKGRKTPPDDIWVDDDWKKNQEPNMAAALGFSPPK